MIFSVRFISLKNKLSIESNGGDPLQKDQLSQAGLSLATNEFEI